jgi:hypothetical protein
MWPPPVAVAFDPGYDGPLRITVSLGAWEHDTDGDGLIDLVESLRTLADRGAFVRSDRPPAQAAMPLLATQHSPPGQYVWEVDARTVDHRFGQIFRNQMAMFAAVFCPVNHATIEMLQRTRARRPANLSPIDPLAVEQGLVYPERSNKLRFPISENDVLDYASERRAEIVLVDRFDDDLLARLRQWFDLWARALDCAYPSGEDRLKKGRCAIWDYRTDLIDDVTIETQLGYWGAAECAWNSYANLVGRVDTELAAVAELRIY